MAHQRPVAWSTPGGACNKVSGNTDGSALNMGIGVGASGIFPRTARRARVARLREVHSGSRPQKQPKCQQVIRRGNQRKLRKNTKNSQQKVGEVLVEVVYALAGAAVQPRTVG